MDEERWGMWRHRQTDNGKERHTDRGKKKILVLLIPSSGA